MGKLYKLIQKINLELVIWTVALIYLALFGPSENDTSFCLFRQAGLSFCPGCGIGHAMSYFLHGEFLMSWQAHPLGFFAVAVLLYRIAQLSIPYFSKPKFPNPQTPNYG